MDFPDFDVPAGVQDEGAASSAEGTTGAPDSSTVDRSAQPDPATSDTARPGADDTAGRPGQPAADRGRAPVKPESLPTYRFDELNSKFDRLTAQFTELSQREQRLLADNDRLRKALGVDPRPEPKPEPKPLDPRQQRLRAQILEIVPELALLSNEKLGKLVERADDLHLVVDDSKARQEADTAHWNSHADRVVRSVLTHAAAQWIGAGKTLADLDPDEAAHVDQSFRSWLWNRAAREAKEQNLPQGAKPDLVRRYEAGDPQLVTEFWQFFTRRGGSAAPAADATRRTVVAAAARAEAARGVPRGGSSSAPVSQAAPVVDPNDEDAVLKAGWNFVQNQRAAVGQ